MKFYQMPDGHFLKIGAKPFWNQDQRNAFRLRNCGNCQKQNSCRLERYLVVSGLYGGLLPLEIAQRLGRTSPDGEYIWACPEQKPLQPANIQQQL